MEHTGRIGRRRSTWLQALVLAVALPADGAVAYALGAPAWLAVLYLGLGIVLASAWLGLRRRARRAAVQPPPAPVLDSPRHRRRPGRSATCASASGQRRPARADRGDHGLLRRATGCACMSVVHDVDAAGRDTSARRCRGRSTQIAAGEADTLVVTRLRDLSPNVANLAAAAALVQRTTGARLIAIDLRARHVDRRGAARRATAVAGVGSWEHERISERTRRGLEAARSRGERPGPHRGRRRARSCRSGSRACARTGMTLQAIADVLNAEGVPTLRGGAMWRPVERAARGRLPAPVDRSRGIELPQAAAER